MHEKTLASETAIFLNKIASKSFLKPFYLSGGTALALHLGHRESEDLDFFTKADFDPAQIQQQLELISSLSSVEQSQGTLNCHAGTVQLQFLHYPYNLINKPTKWKNINISSVKDIACTKLLTIGSRGSKKDFVDIYFILQRYTLKELFSLLTKKYPKTDYNQIHLLKSLVFFENAELQPMPRMHIKITWQEVKREILSVVKRFAIV